MSLEHATPDILILCGGRGTRLQSVVGDRQKCVAEVDGEPFLLQLIRYCGGFGARRFILCSGHLAETVRVAVTGLAADYEIVHSHEETPLGTGGAIRQGLELAETAQVLVLNGDSFCAFDFARLREFHGRHNAVMTVLLAAGGRRNDAGNVRIGPDGKLLEFAEKSGAGGGLINAGVYLLDRELQRAFPAATPLSFEKEVVPALLAAGQRIFGLRSDAPLLDIGTPERLAAARHLFGLENRNT